MGTARRLIQRRHKLNDDVSENVPNRERIEKRDEILNDSPGAYGLMRGQKRRLEDKLGKDVLSKKLELAWEVSAAIARVDFGTSDFGLKVTLPSSSELIARGFEAGDELKILEKGSALSMARYVAVEEANSGDVAAGEVRIVSATEWRLSDDSGWSDETDDQIRVEISAGARK